jgi:hypothetical protein
MQEEFKHPLELDEFKHPLDLDDLPHSFDNTEEENFQITEIKLVIPKMINYINQIQQKRDR